MDIQKLKIFYQVAIDGSVSKSADVLKVNKSMISRKINQFEKEMGAELFLRIGSKIVLTPSGRLLLEKSKKIFHDIEALKNIVQENENETKGTLKITTTHALLATWLPRYIHEFTNQFPDLMLELYASNQDVHLALKNCDVAIRPFSNNNDGLIQEFLRCGTLVSII